MKKCAIILKNFDRIFALYIEFKIQKHIYYILKLERLTVFNIISKFRKMGCAITDAKGGDKNPNLIINKKT